MWAVGVLDVWVGRQAGAIVLDSLAGECLDLSMYWGGWQEVVQAQGKA